MSEPREGKVMFRKKKAPKFQGVTPPIPSPFQQSATQLSAFSGLGTNLLTFNHIIIGDSGPIEPEPTDEPKTVIGLTGYRVYTLDNELYLRGAQGNKQESRESEQAKHNATGDYSAYGPSLQHPAPAWDCLCGFAAFFWPTSVGEPSWEGVLAEVQAGGRTIYCDMGWRAERIVLNKLWVACPIFPDTALEILRKRYEVPVEVL